MIDISQTVSFDIFGDQSKHYFFGYYDKSPIDINNKYLLTHEATQINNYPKKDELINVGYFDYNNKKQFYLVSKTSAWNWQIGSRLQWIGDGSSNEIIFNIKKDNKILSKKYNIHTSEEEVLPMSIFDVSSNQKFALSLNFDRLHCLRKGYGYENELVYKNLEKKPSNDGIYFMDLKTKEIKLIISLKDLANFKKTESMNSSYHWVNHIMINKNCTRFAFLHRWKNSDETFSSRLITSNIDGTDLNCLVDSGSVSHFTWQSNKNIIVWCRLKNNYDALKYKKKSNSLFKIGKYIIHKLKIRNLSIIQSIIKENFWVISDTKQSKIVKLKYNFNEDGHCSYCIDKNMMLNDSYPNAKKNYSLYLYNFTKNICYKLYTLKSIPDINKTKNHSNWDNSLLRCDLHPKWSFDGNSAIVDTVHNGSRQIFVYNIRKIFE
tara:strand:+ start:2269 stop:3570 length:1302 start_codon:yes stop_codon:yes gene_type:complete